MAKYLVTGGAGFIGSTLVNRISKSDEIVVIDDLSMGNISNINNLEESKITFVEGSVTDENLMMKVFDEFQFDYIFHLAAIASVADSVMRPVETHEVNFESVLLLLELCRKKQHNLKRIVFSSSAAVYGDEPTLPKHEESIIRPLTPYAVDKFSAERYVLNYYSLYGVPSSAVRFFNVYGPNQNPNSPYSGVLSILTARYEELIDGNEATFTIFGDGQQTRDFIYVEDVIDALLIIADSQDSLGKVFNVGTGNATPLNKVIDIYQSILKRGLPIMYEEARVGDITHSLADVSNLKSIGFSGKTDLESGIRKYLEAELEKHYSCMEDNGIL